MPTELVGFKEVILSFLAFQLPVVCGLSFCGWMRSANLKSPKYMERGAPYSSKKLPLKGLEWLISSVVFTSGTLFHHCHVRRGVKATGTMEKIFLNIRSLLVQT